MTDFLDKLELQLVGAVERHAAGIPVSSRPARWRSFLGLRQRPLALAFAALALGGTATAAVVSLSTSRPLHGTIVAGPGAPIPSGPARYGVTAFPYMAVGWAGWCSSMEFVKRHGRVVEAEYGCGPIESSNDLGIGGMLDGRYEFGIFSRQVAAVGFSYGRTFRPVSDPRLPAGMWGFFVVHPPLPTGADRPPWTETLLDAHGRVLVQPTITSANAVEHLPLRYVDPRNPGPTPCAVRAGALPGLLAIAETVARPVPWPRPMAGSFEACSNATFQLDGATLAAAVLVNATDPTVPAPALPELTPEHGHPELLTGTALGSIGFPEGASVGNASPGAQPFQIRAGMQLNYGTPAGVLSLTNRDLTARRAGRAWLLAEGGTPAQRNELLTALTVTAAR